jgi:hypothetical protein
VLHFSVQEERENEGRKSGQQKEEKGEGVVAVVRRVKKRTGRKRRKKRATRGALFAFPFFFWLQVHHRWCRKTSLAQEDCQISLLGAEEVSSSS